MSAHCPKCKKPVPEGALQCTHCDALLPSEVLAGPTSRPGVGGKWDVLAALEPLGSQKVYRVRNRTTDDEVALRMLPLSLGGEEAAQERIRNLLQRSKDLVGAPGILAVVGYEVEDRTPYFITEVFSGPSLQDRLKKEKALPVDLVRRIGLAAATALAAAHKISFFHGELRPGCIVLGPEGEVRVTDFGVGKVVSEVTAKAAAGGGGLGPAKPGFYRAPELARNDIPDARSDLYALGCILFEALTGDRRLPDPYREACAAPRPGAPFPDPTAAHPLMDSSMREVIRRLLAPAPADRFESAAAVMAALKGEPFPRASVVSPGAMLPPEAADPADAPAGKGPAAASPRAPGKAAAAAPAAAKRPLSPGLVTVVVLVAALLGATGWMVWKGSGFAAFRFIAPEAGEEEAEAPPPPPPVDVPPVLPDLPAPPPQEPGALRLPPRVVAKAGRIHSLVDGAELVLVPAGDFVLGAEDANEDERPLRRIVLAPFLIDRHEVTVAQFRRFCDASGRRMPPQPAGSTGRHPVVNVPWTEANAYARWAGRRLPTEAEWEKAARGGDGRAFPWGAADAPSRRNGAGGGDGHERLAPAGSFPGGAGPTGALDLSGNAFEWCADWYGEGYYLTGPVQDPKGPAQGKERVVRGGSFLVGEASLRTSFRNHLEPARAFEDIGFRCAADLK